MARAQPTDSERGRRGVLRNLADIITCQNIRGLITSFNAIQWFVYIELRAFHAAAECIL